MYTIGKVKNMQGLKGDKLPRAFWKKGKSKFLFSRCRDEGIEYGSCLILGGESAMTKLSKKLKLV